jgi:hypothetical protein
MHVESVSQILLSALIYGISFTFTLTRFIALCAWIKFIHKYAMQQGIVVP